MSDLQRTYEVISRAELIKLVDDSNLDLVIPVCAGEWRAEPDGEHWRFYADANF